MKSIFKALFEWIRFLIDKKQEPVDIIEAASACTETETGVTVEASGETEISDEAEEPVIVTPEPKEYKKIILLDNGHAASTKGKRSPVLDDGRQFFEYKFNRDIVRRIARKLDEIGIRYEILVPEVDVDVPLKERAARANKFCDEYGTENCVFLSIHANAAGNGTSWMRAKGWSCYSSKGETASDPIAEMFVREAEKVLVPLGRAIRKYSLKKYSWEENFTVLVKTKCPAILTENLFYDNKEEVQFLFSEEGREAIAQIHVNAILKIEDGI